VGASPIPAAADFLLDVIAEGDQKLTLAAIEALAASRFRNESRAKAEAAVNERDDDAVRRLFVQQFADG
jgi:hypothetical protein